MAMRPGKPVFSTLIIFLLLLFPLFSPSAFSETVTLSWSQPDDERISGYNIYCGKAGTDFKATPHAELDSADTTSYTLTELESGCTYSFAATSTDGEGNESDFSETIDYTVASPDDPDSEPRTLVFGSTPDADHPGTLQDTFININNDVNISSEQLNTYTWPQDTPANAILIKPDLADLPADAQIQSATLSLYQTDAGGDASYDVSVHQIINHNPNLWQANGYNYDSASSWTANDTCYNDIPLAQADIAAAEDVNTLDRSTGYKQWDVTGMTRDWAENPDSNYGLLLNSDTVAASDSYRFFAASETIDAAQRPQLSITYTLSSGDTDQDGDGNTVSDGDGESDETDPSLDSGDEDVYEDGMDQDGDGSDTESVNGGEGPEFALETADIEINHEWRTVSFSKTFENPVVIAKPMSFNRVKYMSFYSCSPAVVRIKNVTPEGFEIRIQEWDYLDGWHVFQTVSYLAMEAGRHELPGGVQVEAGSFETGSTEAVSFKQAFNQIPVVVSGVTTENGDNTVSARLSNVSEAGFDCTLQGQESRKNEGNAVETLSFIAWEPSAGTVNGTDYTVDSTFEEVTHNFTHVPFHPAFSDPPTFLADMQSCNEEDPANIRWRNKSSEGVEVQIDEEHSLDWEGRHKAEVLGYMAFEPSSVP